MQHLAIDLDDETARRLDEVSEREGISRAAWVQKALQAQLGIRLPDSFFAVLGTWEDDRKPEEILRDIRAGATSREREALR